MRAGMVIGIAGAALACSASEAGVRFASSVVYDYTNGVLDTTSQVQGNLTFGTFHSSGLWNDPESVVGKPNTLDYDDMTGWGPVDGGFAGGAMRRIHMAWPAWQYGSGNPDDLGERPGWLDGRRKNGLGLTPGDQVVVVFDEPVVNNPDDGGAYHWGVDLIVHGNPFFVATGGSNADTPPASIQLTQGVFSEPLEVSVARSPEGPWYTFERTTDDLYPTQPWLIGEDGDWTGEESDWGKPVDPTITTAMIGGLNMVQAAELYEGSAGGTPYDLSDVIDEQGNHVSLESITYVRIRDAFGNSGEVTGIVDVPDPSESCVADLAAPLGKLNIDDVLAFLNAFAAGDGAADLAAPAGELNIDDVLVFLNAFAAGCGA